MQAECCKNAEEETTACLGCVVYWWEKEQIRTKLGEVVSEEGTPKGAAR